MRDPARIDRMLDLVKSIWVSAPDLRLLELLLNTLPTDNMAYYMEDDDLEKALKHAYLNKGEKNSD